MKQWPHSPSRKVCGPGLYMVTSSTREHQRIFDTPQKLELVESSILSLAVEFGWTLEAWAVFANHYHFIGRKEADESNLGKFLGKLHSVTSRTVNRIDQTGGRKIWLNFWETKLTFERSYLARLNYVHQNAVHHRLVRSAEDYPYCSASWFAREADPVWQATISSFPIDRLSVEDVKHV